VELVHEEVQSLDLIDKDFKLSILNMFKLLKEAMDKTLEENYVSPMENVNKMINCKKEPKRTSGVEKYNN